MNTYIQNATAQFETLLREQVARTERMAELSKPVDYANLDTLVIGVCDGDGIGPIICREAVRVLEYLLKDKIAAGKVEIRRIEGLTLENRIAKEKSIPDDVLDAIKECHVLPKGGTGAKELESANVALRRELDLFANVRPVCVPELGIDWTFYRENTEGEYVLGSRGVEIPDVLCCDFKVTTDLGTERIARAAYEFAKNNGKKNSSIVTKANIMKKTDGKFSAICHEVAKDYPDINVEEWYIDIMTANLVNPAIRNRFQVFLMPNLYGDIITDEAAQLQGGVGTAGSANIGDKYAMFEAIHGSAPRMIEEGIEQYANPQSIIKAVEMLLRHISYSEKADLLSKAIEICTHKDKKVVMTGTPDGATCREFSDYLLSTLETIM